MGLNVSLDSCHRHVFKRLRRERRKGQRSRMRGSSGMSSGNAACKSERECTFAGIVEHGNERCCWVRVSCAIETRGERRAWLRDARLRRSRVRDTERRAVATVAPVMAAENTRARCHRRRRRRRRSVPPRLYLASATATDPATRG